MQSLPEKLLYSALRNMTRNTSSAVASLLVAFSIAATRNEAKLISLSYSNLSGLNGSTFSSPRSNKKQ